MLLASLIKYLGHPCFDIHAQVVLKSKPWSYFYQNGGSAGCLGSKYNPKIAHDENLNMTSSFFSRAFLSFKAKMKRSWHKEQVRVRVQKFAAMKRSVAVNNCLFV